MSLWWPGEWDRLVSKFEEWIVKRNGYSKLQPRLLSRGYQSMVNKPKANSSSSCTTFHFTTSKNQRNTKTSFLKPESTYAHSPTSVEVTNDISQIPDLCLNSLDKMDMVLKQYERAFSKLQKRGPQRSNIMYNRNNLDLLNEDVIQNIFLKCYHGNKNTHEIVTTKV